jgi:hypothetical protein
VSDFFQRVISAYRPVKERISAITRISAVAVLLIIPGVQDVPKEAILSSPIEIANEIEGPDLERSGGGLICYKGKELMSPAGEISFQALYLTVGQYHCIQRHGLSKRITHAMVRPAKELKEAV